MTPTLVWLRQDLRLSDHPALAAAVARGGPVVPVYIHDDQGPWPPGAAARWWRHHSLARLGEAIAARGGRLVLRTGAAAEQLARLAADTGAGAVLWNRRYEPHERAREAAVGATLAAAGVETRDFPGSRLFGPGRVLSREGRPLQVFTAYWRAALALPAPPLPLPTPTRLTGLDVASLPLDALSLMPRRDWWQAMDAAWTPGEAAAQARLAAFVAGGLADYAADRDLPDHDGTSRLSPHLAHGEISPRQVWHAAAGRPGSETFLKELGWREFSYDLLARHPDLPERPLRREFDAFPWQPDETLVEAWRRGRTGFPIVDAGMRQLWETGWMHNRVRMIVGSFLVKDLLAPWTVGQAWFHDTLVDADLAVNAASWQWVAGSGADAAPFFRIFNPTLQGQKFDPDGAYVRRWAPDARPAILDHGRARARALAAFEAITRASRTPAS